MAQESRLEQLPVELLQAILAAMDIRTLEAAVTAEPSTHASSKIRDGSTQQAEEFLTPYFARDQHHFLASMEWGLAQARSISQLDETVQYFVDRIATHALRIPGLSFCQPAPPFLPPTKLERNRIARSLYRFETHCNLHPSGRQSLMSHQDKRYIDHFAPWENEQLVCVSEYLFQHIVNPVLSGCCDHLFDRPMYPAEFLVGVPEELVDFHLLHGLAHIRLFVIENETDLEQILQVVRGTPPCYIWTRSIQSELIYFECMHPDTPELKDFESEEEKKYIPQPRVRDSDSGPEDIWRWANQERDARHFVGYYKAKKLREWAFVMWDRWRIDDWGVLILSHALTFDADGQFIEPRGEMTPEMKERCRLRKRRLTGHI
ncbi:hypothetical protein AbraIFM66951_002737 [Aspergillus brasiliensis]|uniref:Uncharacterized protein n=1 Tax=Aspergillus brasiliensis TaxID=319629 RepID=A0A9W5Z1E3_9EURO|nr:hypothetical protein AbraCBS73388_004838 [Aspergillus brasiliensis]GKZ42804.1 hypothetical protein AbraIFM66951_002737 [Aspergillus brasiliensis]